MSRQPAGPVTARMADSTASVEGDWGGERGEAGRGNSGDRGGSLGRGGGRSPALIPRSNTAAAGLLSSSDAAMQRRPLSRTQSRRLTIPAAPPALLPLPTRTPAPSHPPSRSSPHPLHPPRTRPRTPPPPACPPPRTPRGPARGRCRRLYGRAQYGTGETQGSTRSSGINGGGVSSASCNMTVACGHVARDSVPTRWWSESREPETDRVNGHSAIGSDLHPPLATASAQPQYGHRAHPPHAPRACDKCNFAFVVVAVYDHLDLHTWAHRAQGRRR